MSDDFITDAQIRALGPVIEEYTSWFNGLLCALHGSKPDHTLAPPTIFSDWLKNCEEIAFPPAFLQELSDQTKDVEGMALEMMDHGALTNVDQSEFSKFVAAFEMFMSSLRRLERELLYAGTGLDSVTGLRDHNALQHDFNNCLELLRRYNHSFSMVLARIDSFDLIKTYAAENMVKEVGSVIRQGLRSFDDAYYLGGGEFAMLCKQAAKASGTIVITRLNKILAAREGLDATLSYCVSEPAPGEDFSRLIAEMRQDIGKYDGTKAVSIEHLELSPLQRYLGEE